MTLAKTLLAVSLTIPLASLAPPAGASTPAVGAATPQAAWTEAREAWRRGDFRAYVEAFAPESHAECLCDLAYLVVEGLGVGLIGVPERAEIDAILRRHGAAPLAAGPGKAAESGAPGLHSRPAIEAVPDKVGLYADLMAWLARHRMGARVPAWLAVDPGELVVDGDLATAKAPGLRRVALVKVGGKWLLRPGPACLEDLFR